MLRVMTFGIQMFEVMTFGIQMSVVMTFGIQMFGASDDRIKRLEWSGQVSLASYQFTM